MVAKQLEKNYDCFSLKEDNYNEFIDFFKDKKIQIIRISFNFFEKARDYEKRTLSNIHIKINGILYQIDVGNYFIILENDFLILNEEQFNKRFILAYE